MTDTGVDDRRLILKHRANNYTLYNGKPGLAQYIDMSQVYAAGSLYSTVEDLLKWDNALYTDQILPPAACATMWKEIKSNYGFGWMVRTRFDRKMIAHTGGLPGCNTMVLRYPEQKVFVAVLCNLDAGIFGRTPFDRIAFDLAAIGLGDPYDVPVEHKEAKVDAKLFDAYVGEYELKPKVLVTISKRDDALYVQVTDQSKFQVFPESATQFFAKVAELTVGFSKNDKGEIGELVLHENGRDQKAKA